MAAKAQKWLKLFETFIADIRIRSKEAATFDERGSPLVLWESQKRFLHELGTGLDNGVHKFNALKSRQLGVTTVSLAIDVFWLAMHPGIIGALVSDTEKNREANRKMIESYVNSFPEGYFGDSFRVTTSNRAMLVFSNGARLDLLVAGTKKKSTAWGEGQGYMLCHATEVASYGDADGLKSLEEGFSQTSPSRLYIFESTAKGFNHWQERWESGLRDKFAQRSFFIGWWAGDTNRIERKDPRFRQYGSLPPDFEEREKMDAVKEMYGHSITQEQLAWIRWKTQTAGSEQDLLQQNQPWTARDAFVLTGYSFFQTRVIGDDIKRIREEGIPYKGYRYEVSTDFFGFKMFELNPETDSRDDIQLKIWEEPDPKGQYVIGCDPAWGRNEHRDCSCVSVWRCFADRLVQVAEFDAYDVEAKHCAWVLFHLAAAYRNCIVNLEIGGPGNAIIMEFDHLRQLLGSEMKAGAVAARGWEDACANARWYLYHRPDSMGAGYMLNFSTTASTKSPLMHQCRGAYVTRELEIRSVALLNEMSYVIVDDGDIGAPESTDPNKKDDRVFAMAFAIRAWLDWTRKEMIAQGYTYEKYLKELENPEMGEKSAIVNRIVVNFLKALDEQEKQEKPRGPKWKEEAGLV